jgi:putative chitinase
MITAQLLKHLFPSNKRTEELAAALNEVLPLYEINTKERIAAFLAQCGHESAGFTIFQENLNYSAKALCATWPKRFPTMEMAKAYEKNAEKIANKVYCDRMGNGSEASGEGYLYRGRGAIQLTGKANYSQFAADTGITIEQAVEYCEMDEGAIESACWFWTKNNLNPICDRKDMVLLTKKINGGNLGLAERIKHFEEALHLLG